MKIVLYYLVGKTVKKAETTISQLQNGFGITFENCLKCPKIAYTLNQNETLIVVNDEETVVVDPIDVWSLSVSEYWNETKKCWYDTALKMLRKQKLKAIS
jgi:hypothetical protein